MRAFDQVVTQQCFGRKAIADGWPERLHIVNRLAVENRFSEQILLRVGNGLAIGIGSAVSANTRVNRVAVAPGSAMLTRG